MARRKKNEDEPQENQDKNQENINNDSDETFGLPEVEYEPLKRDEPVSEPAPEPEPVPVEEPVYETPSEPVYETTEETNQNYQETNTQQPDLQEYAASYHYEPERPVWPKILGIILLILLAGGAVYYFTVYEPAQREAEVARTLSERKAAEEAKRKRAAEALEKARLAKEQSRLDSLANLPKTGTIEVLQGRTGLYYIVVASAIDDDLLMDYANKLIETGKSVKIIPPFGKSGKFYRLAIESKGNYEEAQASADGLKGGDFGDQLWVVRY